MTDGQDHVLSQADALNQIHPTDILTLNFQVAGFKFEKSRRCSWEWNPSLYFELKFFVEKVIAVPKLL